MTLLAIKYTRGSLEILDQLRLPHEEAYERIDSPEDGWKAIRSMQVRGAPAIAIVAALSLAVRITDNASRTALATDAESASDYISQQLAYLVTSRPTAVNLRDAVQKLEIVAREASKLPESSQQLVFDMYVDAAEMMLINDVQDNEKIGKYGAQWIEKNCVVDSKPCSVITHCNTGSLATAGYGTALGIIRSLHANNMLKHVFYTETRPYNQGARLTGYELLHDKIPATLITDSMAAALMHLRKQTDNIACIIVGADRVAANGDTANKIGTYSLAILARHHGIKFLVAAPRTSIDLHTASGKQIEIEQRPMQEVVSLKGAELASDGVAFIRGAPTRSISLASLDTKAWNPSFDVTPAELIDGIVTEKGVVEKTRKGVFNFDALFRGQDPNESLVHTSAVRSDI